MFTFIPSPLFIKLSLLCFVVKDLPEVFGWRDTEPSSAPLQDVFSHSLALPKYFIDNETSREFSLLFTLNSQLVKNLNLSVSAESNNDSVVLFSLLLQNGRVTVRHDDMVLQDVKPEFLFQEWQKFVVIYRGLELLLHDCNTVVRIPFPERNKELPSWKYLKVVTSPNLPTKEDIRVSITLLYTLIT